MSIAGIAAVDVEQAVVLGGARGECGKAPYFGMICVPVSLHEAEGAAPLKRRDVPASGRL